LVAEIGWSQLDMQIICLFYKKSRILTSNLKKNSMDNNNPLANLDEWEMDVLKRYPDPDAIATNKTTDAFRNYEAEERDTVKEFYRLNHQYQSFDFVLRKKTDFYSSIKKRWPFGRPLIF